MRVMVQGKSSCMLVFFSSVFKLNHFVYKLYIKGMYLWNYDMTSALLPIIL